MSSGLQDLPLWAQLVVAVLILIGASLTFVGALGLLRFRHFFQRIHAPALGNTWGTWLIVGASALAFSLNYGRFMVHEILIGAFVFVTSPVISILIVRAALHRDRRRSAAQEDRPRGITGEGP